MQQRRLAVYLNMALSPDEIARRSFTPSADGYHPGEVRVFLERIAVEHRMLLDSLPDGQRQVAQAMVDLADHQARLQKLEQRFVAALDRLDRTADAVRASQERSSQQLAAARKVLGEQRQLLDAMRSNGSVGPAGPAAPAATDSASALDPADEAEAASAVSAFGLSAPAPPTPAVSSAAPASTARPLQGAVAAAANPAATSSKPAATSSKPAADPAATSSKPAATSSDPAPTPSTNPAARPAAGSSQPAPTPPTNPANPAADPAATRSTSEPGSAIPAPPGPTARVAPPFGETPAERMSPSEPERSRVRAPWEHKVNPIAEARAQARASDPEPGPPSQPPPEHKLPPVTTISTTRDLATESKRPKPPEPEPLSLLDLDTQDPLISDNANDLLDGVLDDVMGNITERPDS